MSKKLEAKNKKLWGVIRKQRDQLDAVSLFGRVCYLIVLSHAKTLSGASKAIHEFIEMGPDKLATICAATERTLLQKELEDNGLAEPQEHVDLMTKLMQADQNNIDPDLLAELGLMEDSNE